MSGFPVQPENRLAHGNITREGATVGFTQSDLGEGEAHAVFVRDNVCISGESGGKACIDVSMLAACSLEDVPFRAMPNDGILGLGLQNLSMSPMFSFLERLLEGSSNTLPQFGIYLGAKSGEVYFGGHNPARVAAPLQWFPVDHPEQGYWQVAIQAVRVGNVVVDACEKGCHGVVDTGASRLGIQASRLPKIQAALASGPGPTGCSGPDLAFDLGGMTLTLQPQDYTDAACAPLLGRLPLQEPQFTGVYAFGETVLRRYY